MQVSNAVGQSLFQSWIIYLVQEWSQVFLSAMQEPTEREMFIKSIDGNVIPALMLFLIEKKKHCCTDL